MLKKESVKDFLIRTLKQTDIKFSSIKEISDKEVFVCDCGKRNLINSDECSDYIFIESFYPISILRNKNIRRSNMVNIFKCTCGKQNYFCTVKDSDSKAYYYKLQKL